MIRLFVVLSLCSTLFLLGCVTPTSVDYDRAAVASIATFETFQIDSRDARSDYQDVVLSPIVDRRIERSIEETLTAKGFRVAESDPDFRVTFNTVTKTKTELDDFGPPPFRRFPYYGYSGRYLNFEEYEEGTFVIDIIDGAQKELVWRGIYVQRLGWSAPDDAQVAKIVGAILARFPPEAGGQN